MEKYRNVVKKQYTEWTLNEEFKLPDESYSVSDIQDYFQNIIKKEHNP